MKYIKETDPESKYFGLKIITTSFRLLQALRCKIFKFGAMKLELLHVTVFLGFHFYFFFLILVRI